MGVMQRRLAVLLAAVLGTGACSGTHAVSQDVSGSLGYGPGNQATTWVAPSHRSAVTGVTGTLLDGSSFDLSQWRGHVVVVNFWGSWCGPCVGEAQVLEQVHRDTAGDGVEFVGVDIKESAAQAETFIRGHHITYPSLSDQSNLIALHFRGMPPNATPTTIVLDRNGRIAARHSGAILYAALRDLVHRAVAEPS
jgi:thiol-disulfide isomerase/thioredoxin